MKDLIKFLIFILYATLIFFIPNSMFILAILIINIFVMLFAKIHIKDVIINLLKFMPFILFTAVINMILDSIINSIWIGIKLSLVCNITYMYSKTTTISKLAKTIKLLCTPLKVFKINTDEIEILVCISLSMVSVFKKEFSELKDAFKAKGIKLNPKNMKYILYKVLLSIITRVNQIDEALLEKGCNF